MAIDPIWAGVIGGAIGVIPGTAAIFFAPAARVREIRAEARAQRERDELTQRRGQIAEWRTGVAEAAQRQLELHGRSNLEPGSRYVSLFTMPWYVSLYGYLTDDERLITGLDDLDSFRADHASEAIDRMERLWDLRPPGDPEPEPDQPPDTPPADTGDEPAS